MEAQVVLQEDVARQKVDLVEEAQDPVALAAAAAVAIQAVTEAGLPVVVGPTMLAQVKSMRPASTRATD